MADGADRGPGEPVACGEVPGTVGDCAGPAAWCEGAGPVELASLPERDRLQALAALTARFAGSYLRFMGGRGDALSYPRLRVLELLEVAGPTIMRDLAERLAMTARNITAIVDVLEEAGLVARVPHPTDRRATVVELTGAGRVETVRARGASLDRVAAAFGPLSLEEQQVYADLLGQLSAGFCR